MVWRSLTSSKTISHYVRSDAQTPRARFKGVKSASMPIHTSLKCDKCKTFLELGSWSLKGDRIQNVPLDLLDVKSAINALENENNSISFKHNLDWRLALIPHIQDFFKKHFSHGITQWTTDVSDPPWYLDQIDWYKWEETIGPETFYEELYLPKNILNELKLRNWEDAKEYYLNNPYTTEEDYESIEQAYKRLLTRSKTTATLGRGKPRPF